jgi:hypothetical protein
MTTPMEAYLDQALRAGVSITLEDFEALDVDGRAALLAVNERLWDQRIGLLALAIQNPVMAVGLAYGKDVADEVVETAELSALLDRAEEGLGRRGRNGAGGGGR